MSKLWIRLQKIEPIYNFIDKVTMFVCKLLITIEVLVVCIVVFGRIIFKSAPVWGEEVILTAMVYMTMLSATMALRKNQHIKMSAFDKYLPKKVIYALDLLADLAVMAFAIIMTVYGFRYAFQIGARGFYTSMPTLSKFWQYFPIAIAGIAMILVEIELIIKHLGLLTGQIHDEDVPELETTDRKLIQETLSEQGGND